MHCSGLVARAPPLSSRCYRSETFGSLHTSKAQEKQCHSNTTVVFLSATGAPLAMKKEQGCPREEPGTARTAHVVPSMQWQMWGSHNWETPAPTAHHHIPVAFFWMKYDELHDVNQQISVLQESTKRHKFLFP